MSNDVFIEPMLFEDEVTNFSNLFDEFGMPPFSTLDRRGGRWQSRKKQWLNLGIESEVGRDTALIYAEPDEHSSDMAHKIYDVSQGTSIFDPLIAECAVRWYSSPNSVILDPFAGGSVRGLVASILSRHYIGVDLRPEQIEANNNQMHIAQTGYAPRWVEGDSANICSLVAEQADLVFSCPPYFDLEEYSDQVGDLSNMTWDEFLVGYSAIIGDTLSLLKENRFAVWVVGDVRDKHGVLRGLVPETIRIFQSHGMKYYVSAVTIDPIGTGAIIGGRQFRAGRKLVSMHQHFLVFVKGDPRKAADFCKDSEVGDFNG